MHELRHFTIKSVDDVQPGELFTMSLAGASATCIALHGNQAEPDQFVAVVLISDFADEQHPFYSRIIRDGESVMSFGRDWVLDLTDDSSCFTGMVSLSEEPGVVAVDSRGTTMRVARPPRQMTSSPARVDLREFKLGGRVTNGCETLFPSWKIWTSEAEATRLGAKPLFEFTSPAKR